MKTFFITACVLILISTLILLYLIFCEVWGVEYNNIVPKIGYTFILCSATSFIIGLLLSFKE